MFVSLRVFVLGTVVLFEASFDCVLICCCKVKTGDDSGIIIYQRSLNGVNTAFSMPFQAAAM